MRGLITLDQSDASPHETAFLHGLRAVGAVIGRTLLWPVRFYRARSEFALLASLSDHQLKDIGLTRSDLSNVTALPRDDDPTLVLDRVVRERRANASAQRIDVQNTSACGARS